MSNKLEKRRTALRAVSVAAATALTAIALSACTGGGAAPTSPGGTSDGKPSGTINARIYSDPSTFNPALAAGVQTFQLDRLLFDTVLRRDTDGIVGGLAKSWTASSASDYTFTIRDGSTCSDGTPITATVVANSLKYLADPNTGSTWKALAFGDGTPTITANDADSTVHVALSAPFADLEAGLTVAQTGIICPAGLADLAGLKAGSVAGAYSGPYSLAESKPGLSYSLKFNAQYKAWPDFSSPLEGRPAETIAYTISNDESTTANQVLAGQVDFADFADWNTIARFTGNDTIHQNRITAYTTYVVFNERPGHAFADKPELRKAVAQAVSQKGFNAVFSNGNAEVLASIVPASYECVNKDQSLLVAPDADAAKSALSSVDGIKMLGNTANVSFSNGADYIYSALTAAGAGVDLQKVDNATFWSTIAKGDSDWDLVFIGDQNAGQTISASLSRTMGPAVEDNGRNFSASNNPAGVEAMKAGLATADPKERCEHFTAAQKTLFDRYDVVPLVGGSTVTITRGNVSARKIGENVDPATLRLMG